MTQKASDPPSGVITDWSMSAAELIAIDKARNDALKLFHPLHFDARVEIAYLNSLLIIYYTILPKVETTKNKVVYKEKHNDITALIAELKLLSVKEYRHAVKVFERSGLMVPASRLFLDKSEDLFKKLMILKDNLGMGLRHSKPISLEGAFDRAAD